MRVLHVITGLGVGGAETMLYRLIRETAGLEHSVVSLTRDEPLGPRFREAGIPVKALGMRGIPALPGAIASLRRRIRTERLDLVQTWLYHADLVGGLAAWRLGVPVVWNLRHGDLSPDRNKRSTLLTARVCARLSRRLPSAIISCSKRAVESHSRIGYDRNRMIVIPNGFDTGAFRPDQQSRKQVRQELRIPDSAVLAGWVGRFHPQKDPVTLLQAAQRVLSRRSEAHLVLVGRGMIGDNDVIAGWVRENPGIAERLHLLGPREDIARLDAAFDLFISSSAGEALPNAVGEAMASGVPCVVTDVGDSVELVGDSGRVVPPTDPQCLVEAWEELIDIGSAERRARGLRGRERIARLFSLDQARRRYRRVWTAVAKGDFASVASVAS